MNKTAVVIFARMTSSRLPGKTLTDLGGRVILGRLVDRMAHLAEPAGLVVATSDQAEDDPIVRFCETDETCRRLGVKSFRGALKDVLGRAAACARALDLDPLVRISGDSPFMDPAIIDRCIERHRTAAPDLTTNRYPRTFPPGITVEAISRACLERLDAETTKDEDREHVTTFVYRHADRFRIENVAATRPGLPEVTLTVDTPEDLAVARKLQARLDALGGPLDHMITADLRRDLTAD